MTQRLRRYPCHSARVYTTAFAFTILAWLPASAARPTIHPQVALEGYSPVSIMDGRQWVRGKAEFAVEYDGKIYRMASAAERKKFLADPAHYVPALGGDCVVTFAESGDRVDGNVRYASYYQGRLYLFRTAFHQEAFRGAAADFEHADLALGGLCPVTLLEQVEEVPGNPELAAVFRDLRYRFASPEALEKFRASPIKYAVRRPGQR